MKYVLIIPDGCADEPQEELGGRTPLQAAHLPHCDAVAELGQVGLADHVPAHLPAGSAVANMSLLGYDPNTHFTGRAPIEAAAGGIVLGDEDWAIRCNLVTIEDQVMRDFTAGHISTEEARALLESAQQSLVEEITAPLEFHTGVSYRNLLIYRGSSENPAPFSEDTRTWAPHDLIDESVVDSYPRGPGSDLLSEVMTHSWHWFAEHPVNRRRREQGERVATNVWLWGLGKRPQLASFRDRFGLQGAMITAVDLLRGLARLIGWECIDVEGATGYLDTDYAAKGAAAVEALRDYDVVCVHIEATDEASHEGRVDAKVAALEAIDANIVGPVFESLREAGEGRILVCPDHATPLATKRHSHGAVPFAMAGTGIAPDEASTYDEVSAAASGRRFDRGWELMEAWITAP